MYRLLEEQETVQKERRDRSVGELFERYKCSSEC